ncbi:holin [Salimicrobium jeotgali]|nr:holin [Salimicrobium jeotgali]AKG05812.1 holin [Salimicrobium jeotgali]
MTQVLLFATVIGPFVTGLLEALKKTVAVPKNTLPLAAIVIGIALGAVAYPFTDMGLALRLWAGAGAGLSATGLFEVMKKRYGSTKDNSKDKDVFNNQ